MCGHVNRPNYKGADFDADYSGAFLIAVVPFVFPKAWAVAINKRRVTDIGAPLLVSFILCLHVIGQGPLGYA